MSRRGEILIRETDNTLSVGDTVIVTFGKLKGKTGVIDYIKTSVWTGDKICGITNTVSKEPCIVYLNEVKRV